MPEPGRRVELVTDVKQLRKKSELVYPGEDTGWIVADLFVALKEGEAFAGGVAAIQIGYAKKIFVMIQEKPYPPICVVNPVLTKGKGAVITEESCLSLPGELVAVPRFETVTLTGLNQYEKPIKLKLKGQMARIAQHEVDHLEGKLITDYKEENHEPV